MTMWELASVLSKALIYTGMLALMGGMLVVWMNRHSIVAAQIISRRYMLPAALTGLLASCLLFLIQIGSINQRGIAGMFDPVMASILTDTEVGSALRWRLGSFLLALLAMLPLNLPGFPFRHRSARRFSLIVTTVAVGCFTVAVASHGHASVVSPQAELLAAIHLLAIACWAGALYPLYLLVNQRPGTEGDNIAETAEALRRFGIHAWWMLSLMLLTGFGLIWLLTGSLLPQFSNLHGQLLLLKILLVAGMMGLGALHKFRWVPRLRSLALSQLDTQQIRATLSRSIGLETLLALLVLLLTAALTTLTGPMA